jgi:RNA polymerase sigma-70 factor (ECF subfamily)
MTNSLDARLPGAYRLDPAALTEIYETLSPPLYRYAYRLLGNARDAEDSVAETFHRLLLALQHGNGPRENLSAYVYRIAHNLITDRYRRGPRPEAELDETLEAADDDPAEAAAQRIAQARARAALWKLTTDQRQVILLKYFEGLSNDEVAAALDKPVGAIKSLQHRALDSMRRVLAAGQIGELI